MFTHCSIYSETPILWTPAPGVRVLSGGERGCPPSPPFRDVKSWKLMRSNVIPYLAHHWNVRVCTLNSWILRLYSIVYSVQGVHIVYRWTVHFVQVFSRQSCCWSACETCAVISSWILRVPLGEVLRCNHMEDCQKFDTRGVVTATTVTVSANNAVAEVCTARLLIELDTFYNNCCWKYSEECCWKCCRSMKCCCQKYGNIRADVGRATENAVARDCCWYLPASGGPLLYQQLTKVTNTVFEHTPC